MSLARRHLGGATASKIVSLEKWTATRRDLALRHPMQLPFAVISARPSCWLETTWIIGDRTVRGWGEGATLPRGGFTDDTGETIEPAVSELAERICAMGLASVEDLVDTIASFSFPNGLFATARLTVEMALLDAVARSMEVSVANLLGLTVDTVPVGTSIGVSGSRGILNAALLAIRNGSSKIKVKVSPTSCSEVLAAIDALRQQYPDLAIMVDANGTFDPTSEDDLAQLRLLDDLDLLIIEEPVSQAGRLRDIAALRVLQSGDRRLKTQIAADDCLRTFEDCEIVMTEHLVDVLNVKPGRMGSFLACLDLVDSAVHAGYQVFVGGMLEATPGRCVTAVLAAYCKSRGFNIPGDTSLPQDRLSEDLVPQSSYLRLDNAGDLIVPTGVGWGFTV